MEAIVFIILEIFYRTRAVLKIGEYSRIFPSFSWGILAHVTHLDQSRASENIWWIIIQVSPMGGEPFTSIADRDTIPSTKKARLILVEQSFSPPIVEISLSNCKQVSNVKDVYERLFKVTVEIKLRSFQSKIIHNIMPTSLSLYKMSLKKPQCEHCLLQNETLIHMFLECSLVESFWKDVITWWHIKRSDNINLRRM